MNQHNSNCMVSSKAWDEQLGSRCMWTMGMNICQVKTAHDWNNG